MLGDTGIYAIKIKCPNIQKTYDDYIIAYFTSAFFHNIVESITVE